MKNNVLREEMKIVRYATEKELSTPLEIIQYSRIESYFRLIEARNLTRHGISISAGSMHLPRGIAIEYGPGMMVIIHKGWRKVLKDAYEHGINPILINKE